MARTTREEAEKTAQRIREIATEHFRVHGYGQANLIAIAAAAGVTRGAIYHHFPTKQALFESVVAELHQNVQSSIEAAVADVDDPWAQLERGCEAFIEAAMDSTMRQILLIDAPAVLGWETWRALDERASFASLTEVLSMLEEMGEIRRGSADASARLLSGAMNEAVLWIAASNDHAAAKSQVWDVFTRMLNAIRQSPSDS